VACEAVRAVVAIGVYFTLSLRFPVFEQEEVEEKKRRLS
jgi:hypothetical protein